MQKHYSTLANLENEYKKTDLMLSKIKNQKPAVIAVDYDGTIIDRYDKKYNNLTKVIELAHKVTQKNIEFAFISGRNTTLEIELREIIPQFCRNNKTSLSIWRSGGNGMNLYKIIYGKNINDIKYETIYENTLSEKLLKIALKTYDDLKIKPDEKSRIFFKKYLSKNLPESLVSKNYLKLARKYEGRIFAENVKITFVLPTNLNEQKKYIEIFRKKLSGYPLNVGWGGIPFADVSRELTIKNKIIDGKLLLVKNLIKRLKIHKNQVVTFGDSPNDNNKGLLSLPFSFTNDSRVKKNKLEDPPYLLKVEDSPVGSVYKAINDLIA